MDRIRNSGSGFSNIRRRLFGNASGVGTFLHRVSGEEGVFLILREGGEAMWCKVGGCILSDRGEHVGPECGCVCHRNTPMPPKKLEGPARVVKTTGYRGLGVAIGDIILMTDCTKDACEYAANDINRALAPLLARAEAGEKFYQAAKESTHRCHALESREECAICVFLESYEAARGKGDERGKL